MEMPSKDQGERVEFSPYFHVGPYTSTHPQGLRKQLQVAYEGLEDHKDRFTQMGSGWTLVQNHEIQLQMADYSPIHGSSYLKLHPYLQSKNAVVNVKNEDHKCFMWSILSALHPQEKDAQRASKYQQYQDTLNFTGMDFPVTIDAISKFEKTNPTISISVIGYELQKDGKVELFPVRLMQEKKEHHITLLYWSEGEKSHYAWIKSLSRLLADQTKYNGRKFICERCFHGFIREDLLVKHLDYCQQVPIQRTVMVNETIQFRNLQFTEPTLFRVYADFECILMKVDEKRGERTERVQKHIPCGYAWSLISNHPDVEPRVRYSSKPEGDFIMDEGEEEEAEEEKGKEVISQFIESLTALEEELVPYLKANKPMQLSQQQWGQHKKADTCYICNDLFTEEDHKVRDHDHATGEYRGAAHRSCNLKKRRKIVIPIFIHNLRDYDAHLIMRGIHQYAEEKKINVIPNNLERYVSFSLGSLRFLDSFQFMASSLGTLAANLEDYPHLEELFPGVWGDFDEGGLKLLSRKGVYPYSYMDTFSKFQETSLPSKEAFFSDLTGEAISNEEYAHAQRVWDTFRCQSMQDYHDLYLLTDTLLLADIFEQFRKTCLETYNLDPAHYYTAPGLAWDAALKYTNVQLETLTDIDQHLFIERGMRGGISMITHRHAQANSPLLQDYNPQDPSSYILYLDANNLYGWAMSQPLPVSDFQWIQDPSHLDVLQVSDDSDLGYILEVDLAYPEHLHDQHNDYPLAPETMKITPDMLSPYSQQLAEGLDLKTGSVEKLVPNLQDKQKYVLHYRSLKLYLSLGMKLTQIHRALQFKQRPWLKSYIDLNTSKRMQARNGFEKDFFKLMNNSVFGKTMENVRKHINVDLVTSPTQFRKLVAKPSYRRSQTFLNDDYGCLIAVDRQRMKVELKKPIYTGFTVLDLSKVLMYDFHYHHIKSQYGGHAQLLFTDTDSLMYCIESEDAYADMQLNLELFDTSDYPPDHLLHSKVNKKVIGKFKDETAGTPIREFVGLRPKMYSFLLEGGKEKKTAKGVKKSVKEREIRHGDFKDCLFSRVPQQHAMLGFRSDCHQLYTEKLTKTSLSPYDDKTLSIGGWGVFLRLWSL